MAKSEEFDFEKYLNRTFKVREKIVEHSGGKKGASGSIDCPLCDGKVNYAIAENNGHIHAVCTGDNCVSWME